MNVKRIGLDLAKNVFELYGVDEQEQRVLSKSVRRGKVLATFAQLPACVVGMEACGGAHYWARELRRLGHEPRLMAPQFVAPYRKNDKMSRVIQFSPHVVIENSPPWVGRSVDGCGLLGPDES